MFENLLENPISVLLKGEENFRIEIPNSEILSAARTVWDMCNWLYEEFIDDCKKITFPEGGMPFVDGAMLTFNSDWLKRNTSRSISYAGHICLLEGILVRLYRDSCNQINTYLGPPNIKIDHKSLDERKKETNAIRVFRNKVAAHTIYESPKGDDNISDELSSLMIFNSFGWSGRDSESFNLGSVARVVGEVKPNHDKFKFCLRDSHIEMITHVDKWEKMFSDLLTEAEKALPVVDKPFETQKTVMKEYKLSASRDI